MEAFLRHGVDVRVRDAGGRTPLHHAARNPYGRDAVGVLLGNGADINARDDAGDTPLDGATARGWEDKLRALTPPAGAE